MNLLQHLQSAYNNYIKPTAIADAQHLTKGFNAVSPVDIPHWYQHSVNPATDPMTQYFNQQLAIPKLTAPQPYSPLGKAAAPPSLQVTPQYANRFLPANQQLQPFGNTDDLYQENPVQLGGYSNQTSLNGQLTQGPMASFYRLTGR